MYDHSIVLAHQHHSFVLFLNQGFEGEVAEAATEEKKNDSLMRLSWALVHSRQPEDVHRGIGMLQGNVYSVTYM